MNLIPAMLVAAAICLTVPAQAQEASAACKDGTTYSGVRRSKPCRGHGGVASLGSEAAPAATTSPGQAATAQPTPVTPARPQVATPAPVPPYRQSTNAAPGRPGQVWVNTRSKVFHCPGDRYYGKTERGAYMNERDAVAAGNRLEHGESCF